MHFKDLSLSVRHKLLDEIYQLIGGIKFPNLIAFATAIHISSVESSAKVLPVVLEDLSNRFNTFLIRQFKVNRPSKGLLIIDQAHESRYREILSDFQRSGTQHGYLGNIVDIPYFAGRKDTRMLQLADFCAYAVFRYYEYNDDNYLNQILPRFDRREPSHPPDGLKHFTKKPCSCKACDWRQE